MYFLAFLVSPFKRLSEKLRHAGEFVQCGSIRILLLLQPWLQCKTNFPKIYGFYNQFGSRKILFVANHRSNLDTFLLISYIPGLRGLAKSSLFHNVFFAPFMWVVGFIPVDKGRPESFLTTLKLLKTQLLDRNRAVLYFPEHTRCAKGFDSVSKFSSSVFMGAIESQALVVPLVIKRTDQLMGKGDLFLNPYEPVEIKMLDPIKASEFDDAIVLRDFVWKQTRVAFNAV
ncbi:MAG: lysophospholipid acyltransferase family protein [Pseudobdellovibrionaceae bacterium]